jgi:hypothetical protein
MGPTQHPPQLVLGAISPGVKWLEHEADHSPPSNTEVNNARNSISTPHICLHGVVLNKAQV